MTQAQLFRDKVFRIFDILTGFCFHAANVYYLIYIVHEIRENIDLPFDGGKGYVDELLSFQQIHQAQRWEDAIELMAKHTLIIFLFKFALSLLI